MAKANLLPHQTRTFEMVRVDIQQTTRAGRYDCLKFSGGKGREGDQNKQYESIPQHSIIFQAEFEKALAWCKSQGWEIRQWPGGFRAWRYGKSVIRNRSQIMDLRIRLKNEACEAGGVDMHPLWGDLRSLDLAYDLPVHPAKWSKVTAYQQIGVEA
jgi:hypothetical protein